MHVTQINMAKTGYLFLAKGYKAREEDIAWMKEFGCDSIVIEEGIKERLRPQWRKLLTPPEERRRDRPHPAEQRRARHPRAGRFPGPVPGVQDPDRVDT